MANTSLINPFSNTELQTSDFFLRVVFMTFVPSVVGICDDHLYIYDAVIEITEGQHRGSVILCIYT